MMKTEIELSKLIKSFFEYYLVSQRGFSANTVLAYRDSMKLFLNFVVKDSRKQCTSLLVEDLNADAVRKFLNHIENIQKNSVRTRNNRLAAIHSFFRYAASVEPRYIFISQGVLGVPFKRQIHRIFEYLEREEVLCIFQQINFREPTGRRDDAMLRMLYNTGMRAHELVNLNISDVRFSRPQSVRIHGKGNKERACPLWLETVNALKSYIEARSLRTTDSFPLFINASGMRLSRFGLIYVIRRHARLAAEHCHSISARKITPHTFRHTTAMHLLQSGVELNMIRSWLGHSSIETTHGYVEIDLEMKRKTLQSCEKLIPKTHKGGASWKGNKDILEWLSRL